MIRKAVPEDMDIVYKLISELEECEFPESEFKQIYDEILNISTHFISSEIAAKSFPVITEHNNTEDTLANTETTIYIALYIKVFFVFSLNINEFNMQAYTNKNIELKYAIFIFIKN